MKSNQIVSKSILTFLKLVTMALLLFGYVQVSMAQLVNKVKILSPKPGEEVGSRLIVEGNSKISDGSNIWVLVHRKDLSDQWWPQKQPRVYENGNWKTVAYIGARRDVEYEFEIAVATFDKEAEKEILEYHKIGKELDEWLPIKFPKTTSNIDIVTVNKTSH